jgi:PAS domain S-box-containing protein
VIGRSGSAGLASSELGFLSGEGELGALVRSMDWTSTALGPLESWPRSLKTAVRIMLGSRYAMWMGWGEDFTFLYNDAYRPTLGIKHPHALGRSARDVWAEIWNDIGPRAETVMRTGEATWDEGLLLFLERSGFPEETYHTFSYSPLPDDDGNVGGMLCVVTEDTERTLAERRLGFLRELASDLAGTNLEEEIFRAVTRRIDAQPKDLPFALLYLFDEDGKQARLACSSGLESGAKAAPRTIEQGSKEIPWPAFSLWDHPSSLHLDELSSKFDHLPSGAWDKPPRQAVVVPIGRQGNDRPAGFLVAGINPYRPFDTAYAGFVDLLAGQVGAGLSNARVYEQERQRAEALAEIDRAKTVFFSNVSHEFRTPLTLLFGPVEEALGEPLEPAQRKRLEVVHRNALRLQKLVNTLLDFSRIEAGRIKASYEPTDLAAYSADLASVFRSAIEKAGMTLVVDCRPIGEPVFIDRDLWEKVVLNLLSNAFKFTLAGKIEVTVRREGDRAVLRIEDTGTGIPAEQIPHIFERFHRVEGARARTHEGTGIGLALVQELVGLHGGEVGVESVEGEGTTFTVSIPFGDAHLPSDRIEARPVGASSSLGPDHFLEEALRWIPTERDARRSRSDDDGTSEPGSTIGPRPRILLADDNADMRDYVCRLLETRYEVEAVADGLAALDLARNHPPDLVLTDVMMPGLDGFGLLEALRADPRTRSIPVIMLSARAGEESKVEGLEAGVDDYLIKPFGARELIARVAALLEMALIRREAAKVERTLRDEAEAARERATTILESITDAFMTFDRDWKYTYVNSEAERAISMTREQLLGQDLWETFPGQLGTIFETEYRRAMADRVTVEFVGLYPPWDRWFDVRGYPSKDGGISIYYREVTDRKRAEADRERHLIREQSRTEQLRKLADISLTISAAHDVASVMGVVTAEARHLIDAHQAYSSFTRDQDWSLAVNRASISEKYAAWQEYVARPDSSGIASCVTRTNRPLRLSIEEFERHPLAKAPGLWADDHPPIQGWLGVPLIGRDGKNLGLIHLSDKHQGEFSEDDEAILVQLAQLASIAVENARLYQELRDNDTRKNEFLAMLAHELRNPLAAISNAAKLSSISVNREDIDWSLGVIARQLKHLSRLIDDLLDVSRISLGKIDLRLKLQDVSPILDAAIETVQPRIDEREHRLLIEIDRRKLWANVDPTRLEQVFTNLLMNATKYSSNGGTIWLDARLDGDDLEIRIKDNGVGIPPEKLPEMFELFAQGDRSLARSEGGLGIGLTLVKKLVELHGGVVTARSEGPGRGSEFIVRLPASKRLATAEQRETAVGTPRKSASRVLVVDDNIDTARGLARLLRSLGHEVKSAHSGPDAIDAARAFRPEFVLLDIGLPGMDGYQVTSTLRLEEAGKNATIVAVSGYGQDEDRKKSRAAGFDHHLVKPVDVDTLLALLALSDRPPSV